MVCRKKGEGGRWKKVGGKIDIVEWHGGKLHWLKISNLANHNHTHVKGSKNGLY